MGFVFFQGIKYGLLLAMLIGPVFFALIRVSIDKGFRSGVYLALGIAMSDSIAATIVFLSISQFAPEESFEFKTLLGAAGGGVMILFGLSPFLKRNTSKQFLPHKGIRRVHGLRYISEGLLLNLLNPFVYILWFVIISANVSHYTRQESTIFLTGALATVLFTDLCKVYLAHKITDYLTPRILRMIDKIAGVGLMGFGLRLVLFAMYGI